jgi:glycosyltransferase involved in cell wall biosynthesis
LRFIPIRFSRRSLNPLVDLRVLSAIIRIYRQEKPDIVHHVAIKPILYGTLAARWLGIGAVINAPVGMGYAFSSTDWRARLLRLLLNFGYRHLLNPPGSHVVFENNDDLQHFIKNGLVRPGDTGLIRGAGVDLEQFRPRTPADGLPVVILVARMLKDKGIYEFVAAAQSLNANSVSARFLLVGNPDQENPASIPESILKDWHGHFGIEWLGHQDNIAELLQQAHIACLPSYREGLPKALLEAAACGLPIVTTNVPGCREIVTDQHNGFLVPARNASALAAAIDKLIKDPGLRRTMGSHSRALAYKAFGKERINGETLSLYRRLLAHA